MIQNHWCIDGPVANDYKQALAELCQAQVRLEVIVGVELELKLKLITISLKDGLVN